MGTVFTRRFEADLIGSQVPVKLMHLEGLYELFVSKFVSFHSFIFEEYLFVYFILGYCTDLMSNVSVCFPNVPFSGLLIIALSITFDKSIANLTSKHY